MTVERNRSVAGTFPLDSGRVSWYQVIANQVDPPRRLHNCGGGQLNLNDIQINWIVEMDEMWNTFRTTRVSGEICSWNHLT